MKLSLDGQWVDYRTDEYRDVVRATAWMWLSLIESRLFLPKNITSSSGTEAFKRSTLALTQLPLEYGSSGPTKRFERSRWRAADVSIDSKGTLHCEHPWSKKVTKTLLWDSGSQALSRGMKKEELVEHFSEILDARQDTVLLPHTTITQFGIKTEHVADGLEQRYSNAVRDGKISLIDRLTGTILNLEDIRKIESRVELRVSTALKMINETCVNVSVDRI